ncbi:MAG: CvpA family protein [Clostridia bacterium]|nr:CvpA family protein [Clostridia bacterium]
MNYIIDIILVAIVLLIVFVGAKKGFVVTVTDLVAGIVAVLAAKLASTGVADFIYTNILKEKVVEFLTAKYADVQSGLAGVLDNILSVFDFLPDGILAFVDSAGFLDSQTISAEIVSSITTVEQLESQIVSPVLLPVLGIICFAVLSVVFVFVFKIIGRLVAKLIKISKLAEKLDSLLGAVCGLVKGCLYALVVAAVICVVSFSNETLAAYAADSYICSFVASLVGF